MIVYFEGADGVGKSTQLAAMRREFGGAEFGDAGRGVGGAGGGGGFGGAIFTAEPGATALGARLRGMLLGESGANSNLNGGGGNLGDNAPNSNLGGGGNCGENLSAIEIKSPRAEALLFLADRAEHFDSVLRLGARRAKSSGEKSSNSNLSANFCGGANSNLGENRGENRGANSCGERLVFSDRGFVSGIAYALANGGDFDELLALNKFALDGYLGDKFVLLLGDEALFAARLKTRANADKIERRGLAYLLKVQDEMLRVLRAIDADFIALDAGLPAAKITAQIVEFIKH